MRQFFLDLPADTVAAPGEIHNLDTEESHHLATVLRGGRTERLQLVDGRGRRLSARAVGAAGKLQQVEILAVEPDADEARRPHLVLACAVVKGRRFEWVLEKAVELGAHRIVPLITERGAVHPRDGKQSRWRTLLVSALKQSGRAWLPVLDEPLRLDDALDGPQADPCEWYYGAIPADGAPAAPTGLPPEAGGRGGDLGFLVGPEGGWTASEEAALTAAGAHGVPLGPHVLRTETAAVVGLYALQAARQARLAGREAGGS